MPRRLALLASFIVLGVAPPAKAQHPTTAAVHSAASARDPFTKSWHLHLSRPLMLAAWERLKQLDIPGFVGRAPDIGLFETR
jgi:hypothetical protein